MAERLAAVTRCFPVLRSVSRCFGQGLISSGSARIATTRLGVMTAALVRLAILAKDDVVRILDVEFL